MNVRIVALLAALVPFFAVQLTYVVAASHGLVEWCNPYLDSCTSISATGRKPPASYLFRATMLPAAVILMAYWWLNHAWLASLHRHRGTPGLINLLMLALGLLACMGLVLYVTVLGERGDAWRTQRRVGTVLFFSFTYLAQLLMLAQLRILQPAGLKPGLLSLMWAVCGTLLLLGVLTVGLDAWDEAYYESVEDAFEWSLSLLLQANFLLGYFVWRQTGWQLEVRGT
ncbi:hypothetical protein A3709_01450 [Halioglobus sp. HI00S01]|uniref:hypothetical protein n=1 Tax=Halioglobus sp. HI00S01 TaxID=1822214 RepID=UPI0007C29E82|nr:hypothetical protein [Halioglobus sp. HI00S01]KZX58161.1 hypothetical protein A3709_01450 [Halioglobus sp. HI00S01]